MEQAKFDISLDQFCKWRKAFWKYFLKFFQTGYTVFTDHSKQVDNHLKNIMKLIDKQTYFMYVYATWNITNLQLQFCYKGGHRFYKKKKKLIPGAMKYK